MIRNTRILVIFAFSGLFSGHASAQTINEPQSGNPQWSQSYPPFRIVGNIYYVGTYDLAFYLIVTPKGNILINTGLAASAPLIKTSIEALGFKFSDTKILLTTQAHYDHVGAMAETKKITGAKLMVDDQDADVVADGGVSDYEMGKRGRTFQPVKVDRRLKNGDTITLDNMRIVLLHHPGHTKGSSSFLLEVKKDEQVTYTVMIANMPTIITDHNFSDIPSYPDIAKDYAYTFSELKKMSFDIWLSSHASQFGLHDKHKPGDAYNPEAFIDRSGYDKELSELEAAYIEKIKPK